MKFIRRHKIALGATLLIVAAAAVLCVTRWRVWFGQPDEAPYSVSSTPWRVMLTFGNDGSLSRMVSWQCDSVLRPSAVEITRDSSHVQRIEAVGDVFRSRSGVAAYYHADLGQLEPCSEYSYRVITGDAKSQWHTMKTPERNPQRFSFIYVGDVQDTINGRANEYLRRAFSHYPEAQFLVCGGDLVDRPRDSDWQVAFASLDSIAQSVPVLAVPGNHEYLKALPAKLERRYPLVFCYFLKSKVGDNMVYTLPYGDAQLYLLDTFREPPYLWSQSRWLKNAIDDSQARWKIVVGHHPIYSMRGKNNLTQRWAFASVIEDGCVDLVLQAHEHNYARLRAGADSTTVYTISHCSPKNYSHKDLGRFEVTDIGGRYYQCVTVTPDTLVMVTRSAYDNALVDSVAITKQR